MSSAALVSTASRGLPFLALPRRTQRISQVAMAATSTAVKGPAQTPRTRPTQGDLVEALLSKQSDPCSRLVDVGINLTDPSFDKDRDEVVDRATRCGVSTLILTGCCVKTSKKAQTLVQQNAAEDGHPGCQMFHTAGIHPHNAKGFDEKSLRDLRDLASHSGCVAIGECGLDFNRNFSTPEAQKWCFEAQVKLACELEMPLFLHCRDAYPDMIDILKNLRPAVPVVVHCFTGSKVELEQVLELGCYVGITGWVCDDRPDRNGSDLAALLPLIPENRLLIETDGPYLTPRNIKPSRARPRRNEPALLPFVLETVASALGKSCDEVARMTTANACSFFRITQHTPR